MTNEPIYYVNGKFLKKSNAFISVNDLGFLRGYGVFDFLVTYQNEPFLIKQHLDRLRKSAQLIGLKVPWTNRALKKLINKSILKNKDIKEKAIRIIVTGGISNDGLTPSYKPTLAILVNKRHRLSKNLYAKGAKVITVDIRRELPDAKTLNYTNAVYCMLLAKRAGAQEALYVDRDENKVWECTTSNIFIVKNNTISTPDTHVLSGVTRYLILHIANNIYKVVVKDLSLTNLHSANEVFITASNKEILPIVKVDKKIIGNGKPGVITKNLMEEFKKYVESGNWN